jgi:hypothetical protein
MRKLILSKKYKNIIYMNKKKKLNCKSPGSIEFIDGKFWCIGEKTSKKRKKKNNTKKIKRGGGKILTRLKMLFP